MKTPSTQPLPEERLQLQLQRYTELCRQNTTLTDAASRWLTQHGLEDHTLFEKYSIGWSVGDLADKLPSDPKVRAELHQSGLLDTRDRELFSDRAVFVLFGADGRIQNLWAVAIDGSAKFLPNRPRGPWNLPVTKHSRHVYVVPNPVAALLLITARYTSVIAVEPSAGVVDVEVLKGRGVQRATVVAGDTREASVLARTLVAQFPGIPTDVAVLPGADGVEDFVRTHGIKSLPEAIAIACAGLHDAEIPNFLPTPDGFRIRIGEREYFAMRLMRAGLQLKATLRAHCRSKIHVDTLDLYASRSRKEFVREAARIFEEPPRNLEEDMAKLLAAAEKRSTQPDLAPPDKPIHPVPEGLRKEAETLGRSPTLLARIREHLTTIGVEGEDLNKMVAYLGMTSRLLPQPLAIKIWGSFGTGKSAVMHGVATLCPPEDHFAISYASAKVLIHLGPAALKGKFMTIAEARGAEDGAYLLREFISTGHLVARITARDPASGQLYADTKRVEGPTAVMMTESDLDCDEETNSRFIILCADESRAQTQRILQRQRRQQGLEGLQRCAEVERIRELHHALQRLLQPLNVVIPDGLKLPESDDRISSRRDWAKIANLIKAVALLRQMQKPVKQEGKTNYIEVDAEDVALVTPLIDAVFSKPLRELSDTSRNLLLTIHELRSSTAGLSAPKESFTFTMRQLREYSRLPQTTLHRCSKELSRFELLVREVSSRQRPFRYWLDWAPADPAKKASA